MSFGLHNGALQFSKGTVEVAHVLIQRTFMHNYAFKNIVLT